MQNDVQKHQELADDEQQNLLRLVRATEAPEVRYSQSVSAESAEASEELAALTDSIITLQSEIDLLVVGGLLRALHVGEMLLEVKRLLKHGAFLPWVDSELTPSCRISRRTAQRYMQLVKRKDEWMSKALVFCQSENGEDTADVSKLFETMRVADAIKFLALPNPDRSDDEDEANGESESAGCRPLYVLTSQLLKKLLAEDRQYMSRWLETPGQDSPPSTLTESCLLISAGAAGANLAALSTAIDAFENDQAPIQVVAVSYKGIADWHSSIDQFPRVHVRNEIVSGHNQVIGVDLVAGLVRDQHSQAFLDIFQRIGAGFTPVI